MCTVGSMAKKDQVSKYNGKGSSRSKCCCKRIERIEVLLQKDRKDRSATANDRNDQSVVAKDLEDQSVAAKDREDRSVAAKYKEYQSVAAKD